MKLVVVYVYARTLVICICSRLTHYRYTHAGELLFMEYSCIRVTNNPYLRIPLHIDEPCDAIANHLTAVNCRVRIDTVLLCDDKQGLKPA